MFFLSPVFLYALPLCLLPLLWHLIVKKEIRTEKVASLYFMQKLYGTRSRKLIFSGWLELILEMLFILLIVISFAKPYLMSQGQKPNDIYLLLDTSPSSFDVVKEELTDGVLINSLWSELPANSQVFFFDFSMMKKNKAPHPVVSQAELLNFFRSRTSIERKIIDMSVLDNYLMNWLGSDSYYSRLLIVSDLKKNHFNRPSVNKNLKVYYYDIDDKRDNVNFAISEPANTLLFVGEKIEVGLNIRTSNPSRNVTIEVIETEKISKKKKSLFLEEIKINNKQEKVFLPIRFEEAGYHHLLIRMTYKNNVTKKETVQEDFVSFFLAPHLKIYLKSSSEIFSFFEKMFSFDLELGKISLSQKRGKNKDEKPNIAIVTYYNDPYSLSWIENIPAILFVPKEVNVSTLNDFLESQSMEVVTMHRVSPPMSDNTHSTIRSVLPPTFELLRGLMNIDKISLANEISIQTSLPSILRHNGASFLTLGNGLALYGFDVEDENTYFIQSAVGLGFVYQSLLYLLRPLNIKHRFSQSGFDEGVSVPLMLTEKDFFNQEGGVYSNEKDIFNVHPLLDEWNAEQADMKEIFNLTSSLSSVVEGNVSQIKSDWLLWKWTLSLAILCLIALGTLFYFRSRLS